MPLMGTPRRCRHVSSQTETVLAQSQEKCKLNLSGGPDVYGPGVRVAVCRGEATKAFLGEDRDHMHVQSFCPSSDPHSVMAKKDLSSTRGTSEESTTRVSCPGNNLSEAGVALCLACAA